MASFLERSPDTASVEDLRRFQIALQEARKPLAILRDEMDTRLPSAARSALLEMAEEIEWLSTRIEALDTKIVKAVK